jgi:hypothetical protein
MSGKLGFGAKYFIHNGTALTEALDVMSVTPPSPSVETIDTTTHGSAGGVREFIAGLIDNGEASIRVNWDPSNATHTLFTAALASRALKAQKINVPAATGTIDFTFSGIVTGFEKDDIVIDDKMTAVLTVKVSGAITEAAGA